MATCSVGPLAGFGLFQSDGGKREGARKSRDRERERERCAPEGDGGIVKQPREKCEIHGHRGCLLKGSRWLLTAGKKKIFPIYFEKSTF